MQKVALFLVILLGGLVLLIWNDLHLSKGENLLVDIFNGDSKSVKKYLVNGGDSNFIATRTIPSSSTRTLFRLIKTNTGFDLWSKVGVYFIEEGDMPLYRAIEFRQIKIFAILLEAGADPNLVAGKYKRSPMNYVESEKMAAVLKKFGAIDDYNDRTCRPIEDFVDLDFEDNQILTKIIKEK
jgi:hypothetical protein